MVPAVFSVIIIQYTLYQVYCSKLIKRKIFNSLILVLALFANVLAQKRGVFIAGAISVLIVIYYMEKNKNRKKFDNRLIVVLIGILVLIYLITSSIPGQAFLNRFSLGQDISSGRFEMSLTLVKKLGNHLIYGMGASAALSVFSGNAHNIYVQILYENGVIGLILYLLWFLVNLMNTIEKIKGTKIEGNKRQFLFVSFGIQLFFIVYGMFGNPLSDIFILLLYVMCSSLAYSERL
jgi:O-antigen ligase